MGQWSKVLGTRRWRTAVKMPDWSGQPKTSTVAPMDDLFQQAQEWADQDPDPDSARTLKQLVAKGEEGKVRDCFLPAMTFGTAGLRGVVGPGPARMNLAMVRRVTRALADWLISNKDQVPHGSVVVGFDARPDSRRFAEEAVGVLSAAGIDTTFFPDPVPTPLVAFAARKHGAQAAIVVTASHNPAEYNGYKVYGPDSIQIVPPMDQQIASLLAGQPPACDIPVTSEPFSCRSSKAHVLAQETKDQYVRAVVEPYLRNQSGAPIRIAYTPLHGVGGALFHEVMQAAGHRDLWNEPSQFLPDGTFPTVRFPNPEEPEAMQRLLRLGSEVCADVAMANDPDADRLGAALPDANGRWHALTGNQLGVILTDHLLSRQSGAPHRPLVVTTIVSTPMAREVATIHGARFETTLTGFKWLWNAALRILQQEGGTFGIAFEEALGYSTDEQVRDKDGISAALALADWVACCRAAGELPWNRLGALYREHGAWASASYAIVRPGATGASDIVEGFSQLCSAPPSRLGDHTVVSATDWRQGTVESPPWRGRAEVLELNLQDGSRVIVRPSGTEPKIKIYLDICRTVGATQSPFEVLSQSNLVARQILQDLRRQLPTVLREG